jgi:phosphatidylserine decarboxylase
MSGKSLYNAMALAAVRILPRAATGKLMGSLASSAVSRPLIRPFARAFGIDLLEAGMDVSQYATLTDFFTRRLKEGARAVDREPGALVSPVDGLLQDAGRLEGGTIFTVKGRRFDAGELLCCDGSDFSEGGYSVHYLSPRDYHWIHAPREGVITGWSHIPGDFLPVFPSALDSFEGVLPRNERVVARMKTDIGKMAVVMVAALGVGNIKLTFAEAATNRGGIPRHSELSDPVAVRRGDPLGVFMLGSTVVLLWDSPSIGIIPSKIGTHARMGERFALHAAGP